MFVLCLWCCWEVSQQIFVVFVFLLCGVWSCLGVARQFLRHQSDTDSSILAFEAQGPRAQGLLDSWAPGLAFEAQGPKVSIRLSISEAARKQSPSLKFTQAPSKRHADGMQRA